MDFNDEKRYIDLAKYFEKRTAYADFEDMAFSDTDEIQKVAETACKKWIPNFLDAEMKFLAQELLLRQIGSAMAMTGEVPNDDYIAGAVEMMEQIINVRWLLRSDAK
jgi:hypothetical protein